jgi:hypothetical protein
MLGKISRRHLYGTKSSNKPSYFDSLWAAASDENVNGWNEGDQCPQQPTLNLTTRSKRIDSTVVGRPLIIKSRSEKSRN